MMISGAVLYHVPLMDTTEKRIALCLYVLVCACRQAQAFKVYVSVDMEGISGITCSDQTLRDGDRYVEGRKLMAADMNACIEGCFAAGATEVEGKRGS